MTRVILVRHGQTDWNKEGRFQGHQDIPLNDTGRQQARLLALSLEDTQIDAIHASTLLRAQETASIIAHPRSLIPKLWEDLKEGSFGSMEGITVQDYHLKYADKHQIAKTLSAKDRLHFKIIDDEESFHEVAKRATRALNAIVAEHPDQTVLVVTHGGVMRALMVYHTDLPWDQARFDNGQALFTRFEGGKLILN